MASSKASSVKGIRTAAITENLQCKKLREEAAGMNEATVDPSIYRSLKKVGPSIAKVGLDAVTKQVHAGTAIECVVLRSSVHKIEQRDKSKNTFSFTLDVIIDKPIANAVNVTNLLDGKISEDKKRLIITSWVKIPMVDYKRELAKGTTKFLCAVEKKEYAHVVTEQSRPLVLTFGSMFRVQFLRNMDKDAKTDLYKPKDRVRLSEVKRMNSYTPKNDTWYTSNECQRVDVLTDTSNTTDVYQLLLPLSYRLPKLHSVIPDTAKLAASKAGSEAAAAAAATAVAQDYGPPVSFKITAKDSYVPKPAAKKPGAVTIGKPGAATGATPPVDPPAPPGVSNEDNSDIAADAVKAEGDVKNAAYAQQARAILEGLSPEARQCAKSNIWILTHPPSEVELEGSLRAEDGIVNIALPANWPPPEREEAWKGTKKEGNIDVVYPQVCFVASVLQSRQTGEDPFAQQVYFQVSLFKRAMEHLGIMNEDNRRLFLRYLLPYTPLIGCGWVDLPKTNAIESEVASPLAPFNADGLPQFRYLLGCTTVFSDPIPGIVDACFEISAEFASFLRASQIMNDSEGQSTTTVEIKADLIALIESNPWNLTGQQYPPQLNFTESKIDPLQVKEKYRFFLLLQMLKASEHNKRFEEWKKAYGAERAQQLLQLVIENGGEYEDPDAPHEEGKPPQRFHMRGMTPAINAGPKQVFGVRMDKYDELMAKRATLSSTSSQFLTKAYKAKPEVVAAVAATTTDVTITTTKQTKTSMPPPASLWPATPASTSAESASERIVISPPTNNNEAMDAGGVPPSPATMSWPSTPAVISAEVASESVATAPAPAPADEPMKDNRKRDLEGGTTTMAAPTKKAFAKVKKAI